MYTSILWEYHTSIYNGLSGQHPCEVPSFSPLGIAPL